MSAVLSVGLPALVCQYCTGNDRALSGLTGMRRLGPRVLPDSPVREALHEPAHVPCFLGN